MTTAEMMSAPAVPLGPALTAATLAALAETAGVALRLRIAAHSNVSADTLALLAEDDDPGVRSTALRHLAALRRASSLTRPAA